MACIGLAFALGACAPNVPLPTGVGAVDTSTAEYRLAPGDKLQVSVFNETALSPTVDIDPSGEIAVPLIGRVKAAGMTVDGLASLLRTRFADGYLRDPRVGVQVLNYRPVSLLGEVNKPGQYPYTVGMTVSAAVAAAQGFTYRARTKTVFIKRMGEDAEIEVALTANTPVLPGDTIRVGERYF